MTGPIASHVVIPAALAPARAASGGTPPAEVARTRRAAQDFEALFVHQILASMRQASVAGGGLLSGSGQKLYQDMMDDEVARAVSRAGGLGLADLLVRDILRTGPKKGLKSGAGPVDERAGSGGIPEGGTR